MYLQLFRPSKVEIPERYVPESDEESVTEEERLAREEKSNTLKRLVAAQRCVQIQSPPTVCVVTN